MTKEELNKTITDIVALAISQAYKEGAHYGRTSGWEECIDYITSTGRSEWEHPLKEEAKRRGVKL